MRREPDEVDGVRGHYEGLAPVYEQKANRACNRAYRSLIQQNLKGARSVLEIGAGSSDLLSSLDAEVKVACDLSAPMLEARSNSGGILRVAGDARSLPFRDRSFDAAFSVNLLEHVPEPRRVLAEAARILVPQGRFLVVTPNGDVAKLLEVLERLHLKLPEGPHRFLTFDGLAGVVGDLFEVLEHRRFLAFPAGPKGFVRAVDNLWRKRDGWGLFQYAVLMRKDAG